jgi:hypothetical protein
MKMISAVSAAVIAMTFAAQAQAAPTITYTEKGNGDLTAFFGDTPGTASFDDYFTPFTVSNNSALTGTLSAAGVYATTYLNFISAELIGSSAPGIPYTITKLPLTIGSTTNPTGLQIGVIDPTNIAPGSYQLHIVGTTGGPGSIASLAGTLNFVSTSPTGPGSAAPEPATWALMIVGFGFAGLAMRRKRSIYVGAKQRFAYA